MESQEKEILYDIVNLLDKQVFQRAVHIYIGDFVPLNTWGET